MYKLISTMGVLFTFFILWIIYLANTGSKIVLFDIIEQIPNGDKLGHVVLFGVLTLFAIVGTRFRSVSLGYFRIYYGVLAVLIFVVLEEFSQMYIPSRTFDLMDLVANIVGILTASIICIAGRAYYRRRAP